MREDVIGLIAVRSDTFCHTYLSSLISIYFDRTHARSQTVNGRRILDAYKAMGNKMENCDFSCENQRPNDEGIKRRYKRFIQHS